MNRVLNIAVIGFGRMGKIYAQAIDEMDGACLYAVATMALASEGDLVADYEVPHVFDNAEEAFAIDAVDAVVIATPTSTHCRLVLDAAAAGKAIFCEKPMALSLNDSRRMIEAVKDAGVPFQIGFMRRFDPSYVEAKALIEAGTIGRPVTFKGIGRDPFCPRPEFADPAHSGGLIIDMGIHDMDLARWLMNAEVERVTAEGTTMVCADLKAVGDLDNAVVNLRFENGAIGNVEVSRNAFYGYDIRTEVLGSKAAVRVGGDELGPRLLLLPNGESDGDGSYLLQRFGTAYREQMHDFVSCVREDRPPRCTGADALAAFEISLAASYAAQTGEPVTLNAVRSGWTPSTNSTR